MLPPTILTLSLGGVIVIVARAALRVRQETFTEGVRSAGAVELDEVNNVVADASEFLKPSQNSVQAIKSRLVLAKLMLGKAKAGIASGQQAVIQKFKREGEESIVNRLQGVGSKVTAVAGGRFDQLKKKAASLKIKRTEKRISNDNQLVENSLPSAPVARIVASVKKSAVKTRLVTKSPTGKASPTKVLAENPAPAPIPIMTATITTAKSVLRRHKVVPNILENAQKALESGEWQKAEDGLVSYIVKHTKDTDAYMLLGQVAMSRGAWEEAIEIFEQVVSLSSDKEGAYAALGHAAYKAGHFTRSLEALQRAREIEPGNTTVLQELLDIARKMDNRALQHSIQEDLQQVEN